MTSNNDTTLRRLVPLQPIIRDYPAVLLRGKWIILTMTLLSLIGAYVLTKLLPRIYQASASVLIQTRIAEQGGPFVTAAGASIATNIRQNELEILRSQSLAEAVARRLIRQMYLDSAAREKIEIVQPPAEAAGKRTVATAEQVKKRLQGAVDFATVRESDVIKIIAKSKSPREAMVLANVYAEEYYNRNVYKSREKSRTLREFLEKLTSEHRLNLERVELALQAYMENKGIVILDDESRRMVAQLSELEANRDATEISIQTLDQTLSSYRREIPTQEQLLSRALSGGDDPYIRDLQAQLATLEVQRDVAISKNPTLAGKEVFSDRLKEIDEQIRTLKGKLQARTRDYISSLVPSAVSNDQASQTPAAYLRQVKQKMIEAQIELESLRAKKDALNRTIAEYDRQFERIPGKSVQYARLERGRLSAEKLFLVLNDKLNDATIAEQSQIGYVDVIDRASLPIDHASPNTLLNLAIGLALGSFFGITFVLAREYRDVHIHTPEDLRGKGYTVSGVITTMERELKRLEGNRVLSRYGRPLDPHLITLADAFSPVAEAYKKLRTAVQFDRSDRRPQAILVTSPNKGEGKTTTAANLAAAFAQNGKMTLLVDSNFRRPQVHAMFDVFQSPGLTDLLTDKVGYDNVVQLTTQSHLHVLCAGTLPSNPTELLNSARMRDLIEQARLEYDVIILDSPPVLSVADASILSTLADCSMLVTAAGITRMEELERSLEIIGAVSSGVPKYVLNKFDERRAYGVSYARSGYAYYGEQSLRKRKSIGEHTE
jgi:capsular exopolysaccharide synthesis family protein